MNEQEIPRLEKDPEAREPFSVEWADWLNGEALQTSAWIVPAGLTQDTAGTNGTKAQVFLSGGQRGKTYRVTNRVTAASGRGTDQSFDLVIKDR